MENLMEIIELWALPRVEVPEGLAPLWQEVADRNRWIRNAYDPPFEGSKVRVCQSRRELWSWLAFGNWSNGSAFALCEAGQWLCFMQQGECSDEWAVVKSRPSVFKGQPVQLYVDFESISWHYIISRRAEKAETLLDDLFAATLEECSKGAYPGAAERKSRGDDWEPAYAAWRHGGWYVTNVRYPSGACGCVSRNYSDRKWRIVCAEGSGPGEPGDRTYPSRDAAARAERDLAREQCEQVAAGLTGVK